MKVLKEFVIVKEILPDDKRASGIVLVGGKPDRVCKGEVKQAGEGSNVSVGDIIVYPRGNGIKIEIEGEWFTAIRDNEDPVIYGVIS